MVTRRSNTSANSTSPSSPTMSSWSDIRYSTLVRLALSQSHATTSIFSTRYPQLCKATCRRLSLAFWPFYSEQHCLCNTKTYPVANHSYFIAVCWFKCRYIMDFIHFVLVLGFHFRSGATDPFLFVLPVLDVVWVGLALAPVHMSSFQPSDETPHMVSKHGSKKVFGCVAKCMVLILLF